MGGWELVTADEPAVVAEPLLNSIVVEDGQRDGGFSDPPGTDESDWMKVFNEMDYLLDQLIASKEGSWWWRHGLSRYAGSMCEILGQ